MVRTRQIHAERTAHQIIWSQSHDRHIFIRYDKNGEIDGLNFFQGDEIDICDYNNYNGKILQVYRSIIVHMKLKDKRFDLETINNVLWFYLSDVIQGGSMEYLNTKDFMDLIEV